jgi:hypothetical protein
MVTLEEDEMFCEANALVRTLAQIHRRVRRNNKGQVVVVTKTTATLILAKNKSADLKKMSKDDLVEQLQNQILHHHAILEQRNMLWVLNKAETSRALATLQLEKLADD